MPLGEPVPDIRSLDLLRSVAELGSIRQAAAAHHISQPAASMRLRSLERTLDLELLDRSSGRARLTVTGLAVVHWSEPVLEGMRDLLLGTAAVRSEGRDTLRIAASMTVAEYLVPGWLNRLRASDPDVAVSLQMGNTEHITEIMLRGGADIGFIEGPDEPPDLRTEVVSGDDLVVVVAPSHPWARRRRPLSAVDIAAAPLVLREAGSGTREVLERALAASGLEPTSLVELASTTAIKGSVAAGTGPGVLSRLAVEPEVTDGRLVVVATSGVPLERLIRAVWSSDRPLPPAATRLLRQLTEGTAGRGGRR
ncbi:MAG TPA: LysR family transcriptional regulator [Acidimicrobiales bacterium]|jgi:DNA-binding transcriptional LysR family regulator|nr:LysR family transcriptional regulator [Acidimicrobiales bacterium]